MPKARKEFNFSRFKQRYIALKIIYFGWDYDGLAAQDNNENTIEHHLFEALTKTCLIRSRAECKYNRCGRTDKGVSSYGQVVNLAIRSNLIDEDDPRNIGLFTPVGYDGSIESDKNPQISREELNYVDTLNRVLPSHIKVVAWAPVKKDFSSRFDCKSRSYSYIIPRGDLCVQSIETALGYLVGEHDFRNLCSFDLKHGVTNHRRRILSVKIRPLTTIGDDIPADSVSSNQFSFLEIVIVGQAFLYHQIRCIMSIVLLIGTRKESPELISDLLDISKCPSRPNYNRASPMPLSLFDCEYDSDEMPLGWIFSSHALMNVHRQIKQLWLQYKTKALMIEQVLINLDTTVKANCDQSTATSWKDFGLDCDSMSESKYIPIMKRPRDDSLESKLEILNKKKK